ncbi:hypothetical protein AB3N61_09345 [Leptospira sp. WS58.C1]|uniref:hypothetical protein n=1 Tax=Leptospira cinconiae TaxID=3235173 RepID=UPI00349EDA71
MSEKVAPQNFRKGGVIGLIEGVQERLQEVSYFIKTETTDDENYKILLQAEKELKIAVAYLRLVVCMAGEI